MELNPNQSCLATLSHGPENSNIWIFFKNTGNADDLSEMYSQIMMEWAIL